MSLFAVRLVQLQGLESGQYRTEAAQQRMAQVTFPSVRGSITTSNGAVLAMTVQTDTVAADPVLIPADQRARVAAALATPLGQPAATLENKLDHPSSPQYVALASEVPETTASHISDLNLPGIDTVATYTRTYPSGDLASDIVGFTNTQANGNLTGEAGLEEEYNSLLAGRDGREEVELDTNGQPIPLSEQELTPSVPARNLRLTINSDIQLAAEQECRARVTTYNALNCSIVVMNPRTGAILAMAQWPTYDPTDITSLASTTNISTSNVFAPGSTLKPITVAAAFEKGHQTPLSVYTVPYQITIDNRYVFHDAERHPTERYTIAGIVAHSLNDGMVQVAQHITPMQQYDYLRAFGLGAPSGLGLPGESAGLLPKPGTTGYYGDDPYEFSFGQGVGVTAIQMASVYATIANGGIRVQPTLVAGTVSSTGAFTASRPPAKRRVIAAKTASELMTILQQVPEVDAQAGQRAGIITGYTVAAKTGTAQVNDVPTSNCDLCQYGSSYIGIAPADNPQLVVAVNIQDPRGTHYFGDQVAGPAFYDVMRFALQTMKIPPDFAKAPWIRLTVP